MRIDHVRLKNWLNFRKVDAALAETTYLIGPNASGKSNFLDVFRFLRTVTDSSDGGMQRAVAERGGAGSRNCAVSRRGKTPRCGSRSGFPGAPQKTSAAFGFMCSDSRARAQDDSARWSMRSGSNATASVS